MFKKRFSLISEKGLTMANCEDSGVRKMAAFVYVFLCERFVLQARLKCKRQNSQFFLQREMVRTLSTKSTNIPNEQTVSRVVLEQYLCNYIDKFISQ